MLISFSTHAVDDEQEVDLDIHLASDIPTVGNSDRATLHHASLRAVVRDGSPMTMKLSLTECARLYLRLHEDDEIRGWAKMLKTRLAAQDDVAVAAREH